MARRSSCGRCGSASALGQRRRLQRHRSDRRAAGRHRGGGDISALGPGAVAALVYPAAIAVAPGLVDPPRSLRQPAGCPTSCPCRWASPKPDTGACRYRPRTASRSGGAAASLPASSEQKASSAAVTSSMIGTMSG